MKQLVDLLKNMYGLTAGVGAIIPGFTYFMSQTPPLFPGIGLLVSALCIGLLLYMVTKGEHKEHSSKAGWWLLVTAFIFLLGYMLLFDYTTVLCPSTTVSRLQIGFGLSDWTLTNDARELIKSKLCRGTSKEDLLMCAGFTRENVFLLWHRWSVYTSGISLMFVFTVASVTWVAGWGTLGLAYLSKNKNNEAVS